MTTVQIPNNWQPRHYQRNLWRYLESGGKRSVAVWHRRAGKDDVCLHWAACSAFERIGTYWHMLPEASQARKAVWEAVNPHTGKRRIDEAFPEEIRETTREQEMFIRFINGSTWQVLGSDNYNSLVGAPPVGVVFSEWALCNPDSWAYLRPILAENGGWAFFISTPRGENHCKTLLEIAQQSDWWFGELLTADDTGVFTEEQLENERQELIAQYGASRGQALFDQEYYCSFKPAFTGKVVYPEFNRKIHVADGPLLPVVKEGVERMGRPIIRGWDNTGLSPAVVLSYINTLGQWGIFKEFCFEDTDIVDAGDEVLRWCGENFPGHRNYIDIGDPAGRIRDTRKKSPAIYLEEECGISIQDGVQTFKVRKSAVANRLTKLVNGEPALVVDPGCKRVIDGFEGGYCYPEIGRTGMYRTEPEKNEYSHPHDAIQYPATIIFDAPKGDDEHHEEPPGPESGRNKTTGY